MRKLPWIAALDRLGTQHGYDCSSCTFTRDQRRHYKCGWIPRDEWQTPDGSTWGVVGGSYDVPEYCPGYTVQLPTVQLAARLWGWEKRRSLETHLRGRGIEPWPLLLDYLDVFSGEWNRAEAWEMDERQRRAKQGR